MFDLFGKNRKSLIEDFLREMDEMRKSFENKSLFDLKPTDIESETEKGSNEYGDWTKTTYSSPNGTFKYVITTTNINGLKGKNKPQRNEIQKLRDEMELYVEKQEFEKAAEIRDRIKKMEKNNQEINDLQRQLDDSISKQDFESAIKLRDKINKLKS
jgi:excinuclease UvrABC helicase subunit UvrB